MQGRREGGGQGAGGGAKYLGRGLVRGPEILVKRLVIGATVERVGAVLEPDPGFRQPFLM